MNDSPKDFINCYVNVLKNEYMIYEGRVDRKKYWSFFLVNFLIAVAINIIVSIIFSLIHLNLSLLSGLFALATLVPNVCIGIRRMHDIGRPGWWIIVPLFNIYLLCQPTQPGANQYGPAPKIV